MSLRLSYLDWIRSEARYIGTDGCSMVTGASVDCCYEHDLGYYYGRDPRDAYRLYCVGSIFPWEEAKAIERAEVDGRFRTCIQSRSKFGVWSPMALWRWAGVRLRGGSRWDNHRKERPQPQQMAAGV